jgi:hypothetical protein
VHESGTGSWIRKIFLQQKAMRAMLAVTPTTLAGIAAVARYCLGSEHPNLNFGPTTAAQKAGR